MDYMFMPPTKMQDDMLHTDMAQTQQTEPVQTVMQPYVNARGVVAEQPPELEPVVNTMQEANYQTAKKHLEILRGGLSSPPEEDDQFFWVDAHIMGGGNSFSSKRSADGKLRTDMKDKDYDHLVGTTAKFYLTAEKLTDGAPREQELTLYRGIRIPKIEEGATDAQIEKIMSDYGDVIPSSASWSMETPREFSVPDEDDDEEQAEQEKQESVIFHMIVPPEFPLVMLSYPEQKREGDPRPLDLSGQQEVIVGASTFSDVRLLGTEKQAGTNCYHVGVKLNAIEKEDVIRGIRAVRNRARGIAAPVVPEIADVITVARAAVNACFEMNAREMQEGGVYEHKEHPGVMYKLVAEGFTYRFERVEE